MPGQQQQLDLPVLPLETCAQVYERVVPVTSDMLCVGGEEGHDACSGFGGAPLVTLDATGTRYYQVRDDALAMRVHWSLAGSAS